LYSTKIQASSVGRWGTCLVEEKSFETAF